MKLLAHMKRVFEIELAREMAYKQNFIVKIFALFLLDLVGPLVALLIYSNSSGIPGWTFEQFILFIGTMTLGFGIAHFLFIVLPGIVMNYVEKGELDTIFVKPMNVLAFLTVKSIDIDGIAEILVGLGLIIWAFIKLNITVFSWSFILYVILILIAVLLQYSLMVTMSAVAVIFVKVHSLYDIYFRLMNLARYPLNIYNTSMAFLLTFLFPVAIAAHYPVTVLLGNFNAWTIVKATVPVLILFGFSLLLWRYGIKKYASAGG